MKRWLILCLLLAVLAPGGAGAEAVQANSTQLIENAAGLDGQTVLYTGEVIGDVFLRGDHAWINVADDANAIGVWVDAATAKTLSAPGRYGQIGDRVQVVGVYHRACRDHGGDLDIHAESVLILSKGHAVQQPVPWLLGVLTACVTVLDGTLLLIYLRKRSAAVRP